MGLDDEERLLLLDPGTASGARPRHQSYGANYNTMTAAGATSSSATTGSATASGAGCKPAHCPRLVILHEVCPDAHRDDACSSCGQTSTLATHALGVRVEIP
ncbi:hypothetical protein HPB50_027019 [Hyalomma asiaticum]|uniref:Uncharacterized protein n=1 Tax=Hyalomma asiaticum TaxID=266040 RepID=A0ACB7SKW2_HYAAI|nr:hypothetical protein HPB50_027019 [Hyalomma asiaticum]